MNVVFFFSVAEKDDVLQIFRMVETVFMSQTCCMKEAILFKYEVFGSKEKIMNCGREPAQKVGKRVAEIFGAGAVVL